MLELYPAIKISSIQEIVKKQYQAKNLTTGEVSTEDTQTLLCKKLGMSKSSVNNAFSRGNYIVMNDIVFRIASYDE